MPNSSPEPPRPKPPPPPPTTESALLTAAENLAGLTLGELATRLGEVAPPDLKRAKGWVGQLIERALGATAKSRAVPDFEALGVELKTLPVDRRGKPCESTFVCTIPLDVVGDVEWRDSRVACKLRRVLWVPVQGDRSTLVADRRIGSPLLWSASSEEEAWLRDDWENLGAMIVRGEHDSITGHLGKVLQVRPKAANSRARRLARDEDGGVILTLPRGFYLRARFTEQILNRHFRL